MGKDSMKVYIVITGDEFSSQCTYNLFRDLMNANATIMMNGDSTDLGSKQMFEYLRLHDYANVVLYYYKGSTMAMNCVSQDWTTKLCEDDNRPVLMTPLEECDMCVMVYNNSTLADVVSIVDYYKRVSVKPLNVVLSKHWQSPIPYVDFCVVPAGFGSPSEKMHSAQVTLTNYINMRNANGCHPKIYEELPAKKLVSAIIPNQGTDDAVAASTTTHEKSHTFIPPIVFIGGSCEIIGAPSYWDAFLDLVMSAQSAIVVGDAPGVDSYTQDYLMRHQYKNVTVCYTGECRCNCWGWPTKNITTAEKEDGYWTNHMPKDVFMCHECDYGLFLWNGRSRATAKNFERLARQGKKCIICNDKIVQPSLPDDLTQIMDVINNTGVAMVYEKKGGPLTYLTFGEFSSREKVGVIGKQFIYGFTGLNPKYTYGLEEEQPAPLHDETPTRIAIAGEMVFGNGTCWHSNK